MTDGETSAIYSVLRGLDGVDEKMLKRPEVAYLPTVLEDGELPECVLGGQPPDFVVATDRRIIHVSRARIGNKIKKHASYPFHEISRVEGALFMSVLIIHTTDKRIQLNASKDRIEAFIAFVNPKIEEYRDPDASAIYSVLRGLDGVDEKTLERPEVAYLPSVLEDGELPECVLGSPSPQFVVATDRKIVHVTGAVFGNKIKEHAFYPYHDILNVEHSSNLRMHSLVIHLMGKNININAPEARVETFIAFVNPKIAEHRGPEPEIYSVLRGLGGVDEKMLERPEVAYLPSVMEDGEMPECVLISSKEFAVATDRRLIYVNKEIGGKATTHGSWPYRDIYSLELSSSLGTYSLIINFESEGILINAPKERIEHFIAFVNPRIEPKVTELDRKTAGIEAALRRLDGFGKFVNRGEIKNLPSILWENEFPLQITSGWYNNGNSILVATDRRVVLIDKGIISLKVEDFHYTNITSVESRKGFGMGEITIYVAGNKEQITQVPNDQVLVVADFIRNKVNEVKAPSIPTPPPAPLPAPAPTSVADELLKFSELLEKGIISQEEFDAQKAKLLGS